MYGQLQSLIASIGAVSSLALNPSWESRHAAKPVISDINHKPITELTQNYTLLSYREGCFLVITV